MSAIATQQTLNRLSSMNTRRRTRFFLICLAAALVPPAWAQQSAPVPIAPVPREVAANAGIDPAELQQLLAKPLYRMKPAEIGRYLAHLQKAEPSLRERVVHLARKNIGQPYEVYLLGEFPYEIVDDQPLFQLEKSDCLVFAEHTYAMALAHSWEDFFWVLQRMRYRDGVISVATRNHYTDGDWNPQNSWLVKDITETLGGARTATYRTVIDRARFLRERYKLDRPQPAETITERFIPTAMVGEVLPRLLPGDFVNVISIVDGDHIVSHVGLVVTGEDGERRMLHSAEPGVREETFASFIARAADREKRTKAKGRSSKVLVGFKFLRLNDNPVPPPMKPQPRPGVAR
jgi:Protein of unknown function (DUF1460)